LNCLNSSKKEHKQNKNTQTKKSNKNDLMTCKDAAGRPHVDAGRVQLGAE
jgi:hypothetical protein